MPSGPQGPYDLGRGDVGVGQGGNNWNAQASAWGRSSNLPSDQPVGSQNELTSPFWDVELPGGLDPSTSNVSPWETVILGGKQLPGYCAVEANRGRRIDVKKSKGTHYATLTFNGYDPARINIACRIWTQAHLDVLDSVMPVLESPPVKFANGTFSALDISHPALRLQGITQVLIEGIDSLRPTSVKGVWEMKIRCIEYKVVKTQATSTAAGSDFNTVPHLIGPNHSGTPPGQDPGFLQPGT